MATYIKVKQLINGKWEPFGNVHKVSMIEALQYITHLENKMSSTDAPIISVRLTAQDLVILNLNHGPVSFDIIE